MVTIIHWLSCVGGPAHAALEDDDLLSCLYFSLLGLSISLAFLHLFGPEAFILLARAG